MTVHEFVFESDIHYDLTIRRLRAAVRALDELCGRAWREDNVEGSKELGLQAEAVDVAANVLQKLLDEHTRAEGERRKAEAFQCD